MEKIRFTLRDAGYTCSHHGNMGGAVILAAEVEKRIAELSVKVGELTGECPMPDEWLDAQRQVIAGQEKRIAELKADLAIAWERIAQLEAELMRLREIVADVDVESIDRALEAEIREFTRRQRQWRRATT